MDMSLSMRTPCICPWHTSYWTRPLTLQHCECVKCAQTTEWGSRLPWGLRDASELSSLFGEPESIQSTTLKQRKLAVSAGDLVFPPPGNLSSPGRRTGASSPARVFSCVANTTLWRQKWGAEKCHFSVRMFERYVASEDISIYLGKDGAKESVITVLTFASPIRIKRAKTCHYIQKMTLQWAVLVSKIT